jgi:hypothetical protein
MGSRVWDGCRAAGQMLLACIRSHGFIVGSLGCSRWGWDNAGPPLVYWVVEGGVIPCKAQPAYYVLCNEFEKSVLYMIPMGCSCYVVSCDAWRGIIEPEYECVDVD